MILGISGLAGSGKDTVAEFLGRDFKFTSVALADPLKRIARDVYAFTDEQLWGPSANRNAPDKRYARPHTWVLGPREGPREMTCACCDAEADRWFVDNMLVVKEDSIAPCYLTPRYALQKLGTEWGRDCSPDTWAALCVRTSKRLLERDRLRYDRKKGLYVVASSHGDEAVDVSPTAVAIPDVRFRNEMRVIREAGGKLLRVKRPGAGLRGAAANHPSEAEQAGIPDADFDLVLENTGTLEELRERAGKFALALSMPSR